MPLWLAFLFIMAALGIMPDGSWLRRVSAAAILLLVGFVDGQVNAEGGR